MQMGHYDGTAAQAAALARARICLGVLFMMIVLVQQFYPQ
jgi:hypothetical protein